MSRALVLAAVVLSGLAIAAAGVAGNGTPINTGSANELTVAAYGDTPYNPALIAHQPELIDSMNSDPKVDLVIHVGDIHSGSMPCDPEFNELTLSWFESFKDPLVYTPGDNEWTDCHRGNKDPLLELANIRSLFFPVHGVSLGGRKKQLLYQSVAAINLPGSNNDLAQWGYPFDTAAHMAA
jgi:hypothetical protein